MTILIQHQYNPNFLYLVYETIRYNYGAKIVCTPQFFLIESFKQDVIETTVFAYNMQMLLLFTMMRRDQKSPGLVSLC